MPQKEVTTLVIKVDLGCDKCRKKIKKVLCEIPQIQDQVYDEKKNTVTVKVVCCSPDKVKKKICCKGGKTIKGIEILKPPPPKPAPPNPKEPKTKPAVEKPKPAAPGPPALPPLVAGGCPPGAPGGGLCCMECYGGQGGGPCWRRPAAPGPCNEYYGGYVRPVYDSWASGGSYCYWGTYYTRRCYICDSRPCACSNPSECSIM